MVHTETALVLGASGGAGGAIARRLLAAGWTVRALGRGAPPRDDGLDWRRGDAMRAEDVRAAARGCAVLVHAVNPPGYRRWGELVLPMLDNAIAAARAEAATVVLPGTVYNYGPEAFPLIAEDAPQRPHTRKGAIRVEMERRLEAAAAAGALRVLILRAGDFFGPGARNNWFGQAIVRPGRPVREVRLPGPGVGHQYAYLPDLACTVERLLARRPTLPAFTRLHFGGHWDADGHELGRAVQRVVAAHGGAARLADFPWWQVRLAAPFVTTLRELLEMRYLWQQPARLDNRRLVALLGEEPHTPLDEAVEATLQSLDVMPRRPAPVAPASRTSSSASRTCS
ncbi:NAD-dependent epimerase/dehydratase family protein [Rubrivivax gelatinosus]|nr:NAD-dependent epimerase/dehydratase family protein [Rubrivivax gelatinosus]